MVGRAVEGTYGSIACAATRLDTTCVEDHTRRDIGLAQLLLEHISPDVLSAGQHLRGKESQLLLLLGELALLLFAGRDVLISDGFETTGLLEGLEYIPACQPSHQTSDDNTCEAADTGLRRATHATAIVDIRAFSSSC